MLSIYLLLLRRRITADDCLKHRWVQQLKSEMGAHGEAGAAHGDGGEFSAADDGATTLEAAKHNLSTHKEHWDEQGGRGRRHSVLSTLGCNNSEGHQEAQKQSQNCKVKKQPNLFDIRFCEISYFSVLNLTSIFVRLGVPHMK